MNNPDAIVVGSGPNGLAAAIVLAQHGLAVRVYEAEQTIGGAVRSGELTLPGFVHDLGSAIHPFAYASPVFRTFPLEQFGLKWVWSPAPLAHPLDDGTAVLLESTIDDTVRQFSQDEKAYRDLFGAAVETFEDFLRNGFAAITKHSFTSAHMGVLAMRSAAGVINGRFETEQARALIAGNAGHSMLPLEKAASNAVALGLMTVGNAVGWPFPEGGAQKLTDALVAYFRSLGGEIVTGVRVTNLRELPNAQAILLDVTPRQVVAICEEKLPKPFASVLRNYRYAMGAFKVDYALSEAVPWRAAEVRRAATVHLGGTLEDIAFGERETWRGRIAERPLVLAAQHTLFDRTRAPEGKHTLWAYCHVPNGSDVDMTERIEAQIERFAPGFRDCVIERHVSSPKVLEAQNANLVGGDIVGGVQDLWQTAMRPSLRYWATPLEDVFICSSSTPPGGGVHGMCGYFAAAMALKKRFEVSIQYPVAGR